MSNQIQILFQDNLWADFAHAFGDFLPSSESAKTGAFRAVRWKAADEVIEAAMRNFAVRQIKSGNGVMLLTNKTMILNSVANMPQSLQGLFQ